ncbi:MAG: ion channel [Myxococcota bacterium]
MASTTPKRQIEPPRGPGLASRGTMTVRRVGLAAGPFADFYHLLLSTTWLRLVGALGTAYIGANLLFATLYVVGGAELQNARPGSFVDAFFFSVQTMATIGYGQLVPVGPWANTLVTVEAFIGLLGFSMATGLMFAKFSKPTSRVVFSKVAVIGPRDGVNSLIFRVANARGNQIVEARIHVVMLVWDTTHEGERVRRLIDLGLVRNHTPIFALSLTCIHPIDARSPMLGKTPEDLEACNAEFFVSLTGIDDSFSQTVHARWGYGWRDLVWNARFADVITVTEDGGRILDYARFDDTLPLDEQGHVVVGAGPKVD